MEMRWEREVGVCIMGVSRVCGRWQGGRGGRKDGGADQGPSPIGSQTVEYGPREWTCTRLLRVRQGRG